MSDFEIDFEWPVAKYDFEPAPAAQIKKFRLQRRWYAERIPEADLSWRLGLLIRRTKSKNARPNVDAMERAIRLLVKDDGMPLYKKAVGIAGTIGGLLPANNFKQEPMENWDELAKFLRLIFSGGQAIDDEAFLRHRPEKVQRVGELGIYLIPEGGGKPKLALRPDNLYSALVLHAARMISSGTIYLACEHCKTPFLGGGSSRGHNKKRADARFCSDECRYGYHNEMRRKTARKTKL
jgi:hypothetical protein